MARINMVIREHAKDDPNFTASDPTAELVQQQIAESNAMAAAAISLLTAQAAGVSFLLITYNIVCSCHNVPFA